MIELGIKWSLFLASFARRKKEFVVGFQEGSRRGIYRDRGKPAERRNPIERSMRRAEGKRQRGGSLGQMRKELVPFSLSLSLNPRSLHFLSSLRLSRQPSDTKRLSFFFAYRTHGPVCVYRPTTRSPEHDSRTHVFTQVVAYVAHTFRSPSRYHVGGRVSRGTMLRRDSNYIPARTPHTRDHCSSCKRNSAFRFESRRRLARSWRGRCDQRSLTVVAPIDTRIIRS